MLAHYNLTQNKKQLMYLEVGRQIVYTEGRSTVITKGLHDNL